MSIPYLGYGIHIVKPISMYAEPDTSLLTLFICLI